MGPLWSLWALLAASPASRPQFPSGFPPLACIPLPKPALAVQSLHWNVLPLCQSGLGLTGLTLLR